MNHSSELETGRLIGCDPAGAYWIADCAKKLHSAPVHLGNSLGTDDFDAFAKSRAMLRRILCKAENRKLGTLVHTPVLIDVSDDVY